MLRGPRAQRGAREFRCAVSDPLLGTQVGFRSERYHAEFGRGYYWSTFAPEAAYPAECGVVHDESS